MSEEKQGKKEKASQPAAVDAYSNKTTKTPWTLERCLKFARRFSSLQEWEAGAPSSFKAAHSRGWVKECVAAFRKPATMNKTMRKSA